MGYTKEERKRANDIANAYRAGVLSEGVIRAWLAVEQYVLDTHKPEYPKLIDPDDITEGMHVERRDALTDTHGVLQVAAEYGDDHGTCEATLTATQCYSAPLTGPVGFWENAEALADHIERGT